MTLVTTIKNNTEKDDKAFGTIFKGFETRMNEKNINYNIRYDENRW